MAGAISLTDILSQYGKPSSLHKTGTGQIIRFSLTDIWSNQRKIVALWRELNQQKMNPVARTFLGKIISIKVQA